MKKITWVLVNCNTLKEADQIGNALLKKRLVSCFDILKRHKTAYFWPPKTGKIEQAAGAILVLESLPGYFAKIKRQVKKLHSDQMPFVAELVLGVAEEYQQWVKGEID